MNNEDSRVLISKYLYAEVTAEEMERLSEWMKASSENMDDFVSEIIVHRAMRDQFLGDKILQSQRLLPDACVLESTRTQDTERPERGRQGAFPSAPGFQAASSSKRLNPNRKHAGAKTSNFSANGRIIALTALCLLIGVATYLLTTVETGSAIAEVLDTVEARLDEARSISPGRRLTRGLHRLEQGLLLVKFECEAVVVLEAPCVFNILDGSGFEIQQGRVCVTCPTLRSRSFVTHVRGNRIADLGTEYGVFVNQNGSWETHVFEGEVAIRNDLDEQSTRLTAGQSCTGPLPTLMPQAGINESRFTRQIDFEIRKMQAGSRVSAPLVQLKTELRRDPNLMLWLEMTPLEGRNSPTNLAPVRSGIDAIAPLKQPVHLTRDRTRGSVLEVTRPEHVVPLNVPGAHHALTFACWVKFYDEPLTDREHRGLIMADDWNTSGRTHWQRKRDDVRITFPVKGSNRHSVYKAVTGRLVSNRWYHLASVIDSGPNHSITHYLDGRLIETQSLSANSPRFSLQNCTLGGWLGFHPDADDHRVLNGAVDDVMIWKKALSADEVGRLYQTTLPN